MSYIVTKGGVSSSKRKLTRKEMHIYDTIYDVATGKYIKNRWGKLG